MNLNVTKLKRNTPVVNTQNTIITNVNGFCHFVFMKTESENNMGKSTNVLR